jgi:hypothetical protein
MRAQQSSPRRAKIVDHDDEVVVLAPHGLAEWLDGKRAAPVPSKDGDSQ